MRQGAPWDDGVVPVAMEGVALKIDPGQLGVGDLDAWRVGVGIDLNPPFAKESCPPCDPKNGH